MDALAELRAEEEELRLIRYRFLRGSIDGSVEEMFASVEQLIAFRIREALRRKEL